MSSDLQNQIKLLISSEGGQGGQKMAVILAEAASQSGCQVSLLPHYGVEKRGGISLAYLIIADEKIANPRFSKADYLVVTTWRQLEIPRQFQNKETLVIYGGRLNEVLAKAHLPLRSLNMLLLGIIVKELREKSHLKISVLAVENIIRKVLGNKPDLAHNIDAYKLAMMIDKNLYLCDLEKIRKPNLDPIMNEDQAKTHIVFRELCKGCGLCIAKCPKQAMIWSDKLNFLGRPSPTVLIKKCQACGACQEICPDCAVRVIKR